jgi:hypothetical protein
VLFAFLCLVVQRTSHLAWAAESIFPGSGGFLRANYGQRCMAVRSASL